MKKIYLLLTLGAFAVILQSGINSSGIPPSSYTGATGSNCRSCHKSYALNTTGGSIAVSGLPTSGYVPGTSYPLSVTINHTTADRKRWGFSLIAVNASKQVVGTVSSTNSNAGVNGSELSHKNAPITSASSSYTFNNLQWKAPASASGNITFYYVGVAANNANQDNLDYVYTGSTAVALPIILQSFTATYQNNSVVLNWVSATELNGSSFEVERSNDAQNYFSIGAVPAQGNSTNTVTYTYTDAAAASSGGNIFYRLKMIDQDGSTRYSTTVSVQPNNPTAKIQKLYPTITRAGNSIQAIVTSNKNKAFSIAFINESGRILSRQTVSLLQGANKLTIPVPSKTQKGLVFVQFSTDGFQQTETLIIE